MIVDLPLLQERVELKSRQSQNPACLIVRERSRALPLDGERFQRIAPWFGVQGQIVQKLDRYLHRLRLAGMAREFYNLHRTELSAQVARISKICNARVH